MTGPLYALGRFAARHGWLVVGVWILLAVGLVVAAEIAGKPTSDDLTIPGSDSTRATDLLDAKLPSRANGTVPVAMDAGEGVAARPAARTSRPSTRRPGLQAGPAGPRA